MKNIKVLRELPPGLTESAVEAVQRWTFEVAALNGNPVEVLYTQMVRFNLGNYPASSSPFEAEQDALNRFGDDCALPQGEVKPLRLRIFLTMCAGPFF